MAAWTLSRNGSLTGTDPVMTCDTVPTETPAALATSFIVGTVRDPSLQPLPHSRGSVSGRHAEPRLAVVGQEREVLEHEPQRCLGMTRLNRRPRNRAEIGV